MQTMACVMLSSSIRMAHPRPAVPMTAYSLRSFLSFLSQNTSKWVKNALRAKGGAGKDDRKAIAEQLKIGQELRAKVFRNAVLYEMLSFNMPILCGGNMGKGCCLLPVLCLGEVRIVIARKLVGFGNKCSDLCGVRNFS